MCYTFYVFRKFGHKTNKQCTNTPTKFDNLWVYGKATTKAANTTKDPIAHSSGRRKRRQAPSQTKEEEEKLIISLEILFFFFSYFIERVGCVAWCMAFIVAIDERTNAFMIMSLLYGWVCLCMCPACHLVPIIIIPRIVVNNKLFFISLFVPSYSLYLAASWCTVWVPISIRCSVRMHFCDAAAGGDCTFLAIGRDI